MMSPHAIPPLLAMPGPLSGPAWIIGHILTGVLVLPLVEELAFRGYLLRRFSSADFESVAPGSVGWGPLLVSSAAFGLCQAPFWLPGMLAGAVFGLTYLRTRRLGEALAAHVTANGCAAGVVLAGFQGQLW
jgi:CAAX prenyl protease-like protein